MKEIVWRCLPRACLCKPISWPALCVLYFNVEVNSHGRRENWVEMEKSTLSARSRKLFTLSAIHSATRALLAGRDGEDLDELTGEAIAFWECVSQQFPEWELVRQRKITAGDVRQDFIHTHAVVLQAIGRAGRSLLKNGKKDWRKRCAREFLACSCHP